ncbi:hypothetical protein [Nocardia cyriacigeorgica]|uniref:Uncharacterized protein n=1 Tax=Nocardia cyriacigeorgica TaxID=135487 RepID=A0A4U8VYP1_9NOCA|nr:hypothetical protein [Nocardia cyriacigeorgica]VFA98806.1 Uncharacterised protein [Nocardia cyriacigeorgica]
MSETPNTGGRPEDEGAGRDADKGPAAGPGPSQTHGQPESDRPEGQRPEHPESERPSLSKPAPQQPTPESRGHTPRPGSVHRQEPGVTQPRPPTVAEARARDKARRKAEAEAQAAAAREEAARRTRKRVMIGGAAVVGVAALVGGGYLAYRAVAAPDRVTAYCTVIDENGKETVVEDDRCGRASSAGHAGVGGIFIYNGMQYRYYYGGNNTVGQPPTGGTTVKPKGAEITTKSGTVIQRGGLGSKSGGGS